MLHERADRLAERRRLEARASKEAHEMALQFIRPRPCPARSSGDRDGDLWMSVGSCICASRWDPSLSPYVLSTKAPGGQYHKMPFKSWLRSLKASQNIVFALILALLLVAYDIEYAQHPKLRSRSSSTTLLARSKDVSRSILARGVDVEYAGVLSSPDDGLVRRDDYSCGKGRPCSNGACCGSSGYCGYGSTYCGSGCTSNCNATAECGQYSSPAGKTCPLNTW